MKYPILLLFIFAIFSYGQKNEESENLTMTDMEVNKLYGLDFKVLPSDFTGKNFFDILKILEDNPKYKKNKNNNFLGIKLDPTIRKNDPQLLENLDIIFSKELTFMDILDGVVSYYGKKVKLEQGKLIIYESEKMRKNYLITPQIQLFFNSEIRQNILSEKIKKLSSPQKNLVVRVGSTKKTIIIEGFEDDIKRVDSLFHLIETSEYFRISYTGR